MKMKFDVEAYKAKVEQYFKDQQEKVERGEITQEEADLRCWLHEVKPQYLIDY